MQTLFKQFEDKAKRGGNWLSTFNHFKKFSPEATKMDDKKIQRAFIKFSEYLNKLDIAKSSVNSYIKNIKTLCNENNLECPISYLKAERKERDYLSLEELEKLSNTKCDCPELKAAALFSSLTGLRYSDIEFLGKNDLTIVNGMLSIKIQQRKTRNQIIIPLSDKAQKLLEGRELSNRFFRIGRGRRESGDLKRWLERAGLDGSITFHAFRHSFASNLINSGVELLVVQKLLGHVDMKTTLIYTHVNNNTKINALNKL